ncbi:hypothetical protein [Mastigocoleus testarum]|uniref:hypothetical protein n=1 Tax=Mastigocoleus testarum TaxID=996925 RepID=UPI000AA9FC88|nr:hypothetical protein [Mastigocoleus testarum]
MIIYTYGEWGLGTGDWRLAIGDWDDQLPITNYQLPITHYYSLLHSPNSLEIFSVTQ